MATVPGPRRDLAALAAREHPDERLSQSAAELVFAGIPANTRATYAKQWRKFVNWCGDVGRVELPATEATIIEWMDELRRRPGRYGRPTSPASVRLSLAVIAVAHKQARRPDGTRGYVPPTVHPEVQRAFRGYRRRWLEAGHRPDTAYPLAQDELSLMVGTLDTRSVKGVRDAAILAVGYDMGARRSELCAINLEDVEFRRDPDGREELIVHVPMSKTDQAGEGDHVVLPAHDPEAAGTCPVRLVRAWLGLLDARGMVSGPLFRVCRGGGPAPLDGRPRKSTITTDRLTARAVEDIVATTATAAGLDTGVGRRRHIVPHSLRAGAATAAAGEGADVPELAEHFRWSPNSPTPVRYVRHGRKRSKNPIARVWTRRDVPGA